MAEDLLFEEKIGLIHSPGCDYGQLGLEQWPPLLLLLRLVHVPVPGLGLERPASLEPVAVASNWPFVVAVAEYVEELEGGDREEHWEDESQRQRWTSRA
jgi:hypothetical protein